MKKKVFSLIVFFIVVFLLVPIGGCADQKDDISDFQTYTDGELSNGPASVDDPIDTDLPVGERLIYFEDFEDEKLSSNSDSVMASLGWSTDSIANGAYYDNTAKYNIAHKNGSNRLFVINNKDDATDSYAIILSDAIMGKFHESNYTYQYDITYSSSGDSKRYIALVSEYSGDIYNTFHLRANGTANNQQHMKTSWFTYDVKGENYAASTDKNSICNKLLGVSYSESKMPTIGLSFSLRYVVDWEEGNSVYIRLNTEGYSNSGTWVLVSKSSPDAKGAEQFKSSIGGSAIALKIGGKINGYIDNIIVWEGVGDEPEDKSSPLVDSKSDKCSGHSFEGDGSCIDPNKCKYCGELSKNNTNGQHDYVELCNVKDSCCTVCDGYKSSVEAGWLIPQTPMYVGGNASKSVYLSGQGIELSKLEKKYDSLMTIVSDTNEQQFSEYRDKLKAYGAEEIYNRTQDSNIYCQYMLRSNYLYVYFTSSSKEVRIILDTQSNSSVKDFEYTYVKNKGESTVLYQYGLPMTDGSADDASKVGNGMLYVIKLADNSVFVIDGGSYCQFDTAQIDGFMSFLRNITGTPNGGKVKITAWYISHCHQDHMSGFLLFLKKYYKNLDFDRIMFNFPSFNSDVSVFAHSESPYRKLINYIDGYTDDDVKYMKIHTGQSFDIADVRVDVLYTHEDLVYSSDCASEVAGDYNNSCSVISVAFDGKSFLCLGDINKKAMQVLVKNNSKDTLKADILQPAHHVLNDLSTLYEITKADVVLVPTSKYVASKTEARKKIWNSAIKYAKKDMVFYESDYTVGLSVKNGNVEKIFELKIDGGKHTGWSW